MLTTQRHLLGLYCEIEIVYGFDANEHGAYVEIEEVWILGYFPEGCESAAVKRGDYVGINAKADIRYLTDAETADLEAACRAHSKALADEVYDHE